MRRSALLGTLAAAAVALVSAFAGATSLKPISVDRAARRAQAVVVGTVQGVSCRRAVGPSGRTRIFTDYDLGDLSVAAGSVSSRNVVLSVIGGTMDGRTLRVEGAPVLEVGGRYVVFLDPAEPLCGIAGWSQGLFRVERAPDGSDRVLTADGRAVAAVEGGKAVAGERAMTLAAFLGVARDARLAAGEPAPPTPRGGRRIEEGGR